MTVYKADFASGIVKASASFVRIGLFSTVKQEPVRDKNRAEKGPARRKILRKKGKERKEGKEEITFYIQVTNELVRYYSFLAWY